MDGQDMAIVTEFEGVSKVQMLAKNKKDEERKRVQCATSYPNHRLRKNEVCLP